MCPKASTVSRTRLQSYLDVDLKALLDGLSLQSGLSRPTLLDEAVLSFLEVRGVGIPDAVRSRVLASIERAKSVHIHGEAPAIQPAAEC